jgi:hypothetical protein
MTNKSKRNDYEKKIDSLWDNHSESFINEFEEVIRYIYLLTDEIDESDEIERYRDFREIYDHIFDKEKFLLDFNNALNYCINNGFDYEPKKTALKIINLRLE